MNTLPEDWIDILPAELSLSGGESNAPKAKTASRVQPGDLIVFEWRVENDRAVPGAWIRISETRRAMTRYFCSWDEIHGEVLLTNEERQNFLRGQVPRLEWNCEFDCPVTLRLAPDFDLTIEKLERSKGASFQRRWTPERLTIRDLRPELMLRAGALPSVNYKKGHDDGVDGPTSLEIELAGRESAYTRDPSRSADKHASAILPDEVGAVSRMEVLQEGQRSAIKRAPNRAGRRKRRSSSCSQFRSVL